MNLKLNKMELSESNIQDSVLQNDKHSFPISDNQRIKATNGGFISSNTPVSLKKKH